MPAASAPSADARPTRAWRSVRARVGASAPPGVGCREGDLANAATDGRVGELDEHATRQGVSLDALHADDHLDGPLEVSRPRRVTEQTRHLQTQPTSSRAVFRGPSAPCGPGPTRSVPLEQAMPARLPPEESLFDKFWMHVWPAYRNVRTTGFSGHAILASSPAAPSV